MTSILDDCPHDCLLPDGQSTLYDALPPFDEDLAGDVTADELLLSSPPETLDESQGAGGSSLPATPAERPCTFCPNSLPLPPASCPSRATLVLDLDGTLIASEELNAPNSTYLWSPNAGARMPDYEAMGRRVWLRPGVREFLTAVRPHFEIVLFTAATQNWAAAAVEQLDPSAELFDVMLHRDHTTSDLMWDYVKDLSRLGRDLARVVIVDDNPLMFMYQPDNALHIGAYEASMAGGPDNVLQRVAELLIDQVAPAEDVRDILGPLASAKSCVLSTVTTTAAHDVLPEPQNQAVDAALAAGCDGGSIAVPAPDYCGGDHSAVALDADTAAGYTAAMDCGAAAMDCAASAGDREEANPREFDVEGCEEADNGQQDEQEHMQEVDEQQEHQEGGEQHQHQSAHAHSNQEQSSSPDPHSTLLVGVAKAFDWDSDSEGAETFDEHGAAAQLGADVEDACHRHRDWEQHRSRTGSEDVAAAAPADGRGVEGGEEQEESDVVPSEEEHSARSSEDFEALMEDAIAEYDSDAYEGRYDGELAYDGACPAGSAAAATVSPALTLMDRPGACGSLGRQASGSCCDGEGCPYSCSLRPCAFHMSCDGGICGSEQGPGGHPHGSADELTGPPPFVDSCVEAGGGADFRPAILAPAIAERTAGDLGATDVVAGPVQPGSAEAAAAGLNQIVAGGDVDGPQLQTRQSSLPTGMIFLTDLNPAFGAGCSLADGEQSPLCEVDGAEGEELCLLPPHEGEELCQLSPHEGAARQARAPRAGCKRLRAVADMETEEHSGRCLAARTLCSGAPASSRLHLGEDDALPAVAPSEMSSTETRSFASAPAAATS